MYICMYPSRVVILNDPADITKAFGNKSLNSRPPFLPAMIYVGGENHGKRIK